MIFRIYALRGTGPWWLIDTGPGTPRCAAKHWAAKYVQQSQTADGTQPHKWIKVEADEMLLIDRQARFIGFEAERSCKT